MKHIFQIIIITYILSSCSLTRNKKPALIITIKPTEIAQQIAIPPFPDAVLQVAKTKTIDWLAVVIPLISQLINIPKVELSGALLINTIKNDTNMSIQLTQVTNAVINALNNQNVFKLIPQSAILNARKALGLPRTDSLVTLSKAIGLARYMQADYVLYSVISGNQQYSEIKMQLIGTKTGEIVWTGKNNI